MHPRVQELTERLQLQRHPEGGRYAEWFRSHQSVLPQDGRALRSAVTSIFFLLARGETARWHQVTSDELWHFYEGAPLELAWHDPTTQQSGLSLLGPANEAGDYLQVVPAGRWQAARTTGDYSLVGCTVAPGFEFDDYRLFEPGGSELTQLKQLFPTWPAR